MKIMGLIYTILQKTGRKIALALDQTARLLPLLPDGRRDFPYGAES